MLARTLASEAGERLLQRWFPFPFPRRAPPKSSGLVVTVTIEGGTGFRDKPSFTAHSFHWGISQIGSSSGRADQGEGMASGTHDFSVVKRIDDLSPALFEAAVSGDRIDTLTLVLEKDGESYATYTFKGLYVSSVRPGGGGGSEFPLEEIGFNYESVTYKYKKAQ